MRFCHFSFVIPWIERATVYLLLVQNSSSSLEGYKRNHSPSTTQYFAKGFWSDIPIFRSRFVFRHLRQKISEKIAPSGVRTRVSRLGSVNANHYTNSAYLTFLLSRTWRPSHLFLFCFSKLSSESWAAVVKPRENVKHIPASVNGSVCVPLRIVWKTWIKFRYDETECDFLFRMSLSWILRNVWLLTMKTCPGKIHEDIVLLAEAANFIACIATSISSTKKRWMITWLAKSTRRSR